MASAMILAAGLGTRLDPLTRELPKPLVWVGDRPQLAHVLDVLKGAVSVVVVNTHHLADAWDEGVLSSLPLRPRLVHEPDILGTAGGVANAGGVLGPGPVLVWNGDILGDLDAAALLAAHAVHAAELHALATLAVGDRQPVGSGTVGLDAAGRIVRLRACRAGIEAWGADYVGVAVVGPALRDRLPREGCLVGDALIPALERGEVVQSFTTSAAWSDVGTLPDYLEANRRWLGRQGADAHVGPGADVASAVRLAGTVVGAGARVLGTGDVLDSVVWPGVTAQAPLCRQIVTPSRIVTVPHR